MSGVNFLEKLLDGVEVEWKPLGELGNLVRGNGLQKKTLLKKVCLPFIMDRFTLITVYPLIEQNLLSHLNWQNNSKR